MLRQTAIELLKEHEPEFRDAGIDLPDRAWPAEASISEENAVQLSRHNGPTALTPSPTDCGYSCSHRMALPKE